MTHNNRPTQHRTDTIRTMPTGRHHHMTTSVDTDLHTWITTTAQTEHRTRSNLLWTLLTEARDARETAARTQHNGHPTHIAGQTAIPVPGIRP